MSKQAMFISKSKEKFGDRFDYSEVQYTKTDTPVKLICSVHGSFTIQPKNHLRSEYGCPHCAKEGMTAKMLLSWDDVLVRLKAVHGDRYDYSRVEYSGMFNPITIVCKDHGEFQMIPTNHEAGQGCRACHLKLPAGESAQPVARREVERKNVARLAPAKYGMLNMMRPTK